LSVKNYIYIFKTPNGYQVFRHGDILHDPNLNIEVPLGVILAT